MNPKHGEHYMKTKLAQATWAGLLMGHLLAASPADAAVTVSGAATSSGEQITVQILADITSPAIVSYCFKVFYDPASLRVLSATRNDAVWYFSAGTDRVGYMNPDTSRPGEVLLVGGKMDAANATQGVVGDDVLLGTILFERLNPNAPNFSMSIGREGQYANFVTIAGATLDAQPGEVKFNNVSPHPGDQDLDGLSDGWERRFFGGADQAYCSDDSDGDGMSNLSEEKLGSDPTDRNSNLRLVVHQQRGGAVLEWASAPDRIYAIEASDDLRKFRTLEPGVEATPPLNVFRLGEAEGKSAAFYRIRLETIAKR